MKIPPELEAYLASNKLDEDYKNLLDAIRKGNWNYDETKLEAQYKTINNLLKVKNLGWWKYFNIVRWIGLASLFIASANGGNLIGIFSFIFILQIPEIILAIAIGNAKTFLTHTYKLTAGGIKTG